MSGKKSKKSIFFFQIKNLFEKLRVKNIILVCALDVDLKHELFYNSLSEKCSEMLKK